MISSYWELFLQSPAYYLYWGTAIVATGVFLLQILLLLFGFDTDADFSGGDVSFDVDGLSLVSIKTVACFLLGFGWTGVLCYTEITDPVWLAVVALSVGALFMLIVYWLLRQVLHLSQNATFSTTQSVGSVGDVYLRIPAGRGELGKVMVSVAGSLHELAAQSADGSELPTGAKCAWSMRWTISRCRCSAWLDAMCIARGHLRNDKRFFITSLFFNFNSHYHVSHSPPGDSGRRRDHHARRSTQSLPPLSVG